MPTMIVLEIAHATQTTHDQHESGCGFFTEQLFIFSEEESSETILRSVCIISNPSKAIIIINEIEITKYKKVLVL